VNSEKDFSYINLEASEELYALDGPSVSPTTAQIRRFQVYDINKLQHRSSQTKPVTLLVLLDSGNSAKLAITPRNFL
jgi:hypothetical protein